MSVSSSSINTVWSQAPSSYNLLAADFNLDWEHLVKTKNWSTIANALITEAHLGIPRENVNFFASYLWRLFIAWSEQWKNSPPPKEQRQAVRKLFFLCSDLLQQTSTPQKIEHLLTLIQRGYKEQPLIQMLSLHQEKGLAILTQDHFAELLGPKIDECFDCERLQRFHKIQPSLTYDHVIGHLSCKPLPRKDQLLGLINFLRLIDKAHFGSIKYSIAVQLVSERRYSELFDYDFSLNLTVLFHMIFRKHLEASDFLVAEEILNQWRILTKESLELHEFDLLESRIAHKHNPEPIVNRLISIWKTHQQHQNEIAQHSLLLCKHIAIHTKKMSSTTAVKLWSVFSEAGLDNIDSPTYSPLWDNLFKNLWDNKAYNTIWEALWHRLNINNQWDVRSEAFFKALLATALKPRYIRKNNQARTQYLPLILNKLENRVAWERTINRVSGLTVIVIRNLAAMRRSSQLNPSLNLNPELDPNQIGRKILTKVSLADLIPTERETLELMYNRLDNSDPSPLPIPVIVISQPSRWTRKDLSRCMFFGFVTAFLISLITLRIFYLLERKKIIQSLTMMDGSELPIDDDLSKVIAETANDYISRFPGRRFEISVVTAEEDKPVLTVGFEPQNPFL